MNGGSETLESAGRTDETPQHTSVVRLFDMEINSISFDELCATLDVRFAQGQSTLMFTPNVDHIVRYNKLEEFREIYDKADLKLADGMPLLWAARFLGKPLAAKLSGSDLVPALCEWAAANGRSVYLFGAAPGVADEAAQELCRRYPGLIIAGTDSPPIGFDKDPELNGAALEAIRKAEPDFLFVALGSPKQEIWIGRHGDELGACAAMGIGATLDFIAGRVRRAPRWMQRSGLEWVWRLCQEPRRLWRRYLVEDSAIVSLFIRELFKGRSKQP